MTNPTVRKCEKSLFLFSSSFSFFAFLTILNNVSRNYIFGSYCVHVLPDALVCENVQSVKLNEGCRQTRENP